MYSIVDIETTGGNSRLQHIIEIAAVKHDGKQVVDVFHSYIDPGYSIPPFITKLTGITNEKLIGAPSFDAIAVDLFQFLGDTVFVAHNVGFDYGFVKNQFKNAGITYNPKRLCTVRMSRKLLPGHASYSLGRLCQALQIEITGRHTALGDTMATVKVFEILLQKDTDGLMGNMLKRNSQEYTLPPHIDKELVESLPETMGIYHFVNHKKEVIYVGKSQNIRKRIKGHFALGSTTRERVKFVDEIADIKFKTVQNELIIDIIECHDIKRHWPKYNREYKKRSQGYGIYTYVNQRNQVQFRISKVLLKSKPVKVFYDYITAFNYLKEMVQLFNLCPNQCGLQDKAESCWFEGQVKRCCRREEGHDADKSQEAFIYLKENRENFILSNDAKGNTAFVLVESGTYKGYGMVPSELFCSDYDFVKSHLIPMKTSLEIQSIIWNQLLKADADSIKVFQPNEPINLFIG